MTDPRIEAAVSEWMRQINSISIEKTGVPAKWTDPEILSNIRNAMVASIAAAGAAAWRPIESAPSGVAVLVMERDGFCAEAKKHTRGFYKGWWVCSSACNPKESLKPTRWQPLPSPRTTPEPTP